ncbi:MAG: AMP-binding protein, partial [Salinisphaera sp.]|nr:AMP-binding protein [Salinisphaera sp.]
TSTDSGACASRPIARNSWRIAGVGAETIRKDVLVRLSAALAPAGFDADAFMACYGMAECSLAISFAPVGGGLQVDRVDAQSLAQDHRAEPTAVAADDAASEFVVCGRVLPEYELQVRDCAGRTLPEREVGTIMVRGPSVMSGYFQNAEATQAALSADGWLNTGDMGYRIGERIVITGRAKDLMIVNGRNIWPQDLEWLAEHQPELRLGDALAFSAPSTDGPDAAVLVVQCRVREPAARRELVQRIEGLIRRELGIECLVDAVAPHTLPRTSSGKLSRAGARRDYVARLQQSVHLRQRERAAAAARADRKTG